MVLTLDSPITPDLLERIRAEPGLLDPARSCSRGRMDNWPEPVRRVAGVLHDSRVEARIEEFGEGTPTAEDAANAAGSPVEQIVKTLVFSCDGRAIVVMVPGDKRADTEKVAALAGGERVKSVRPDAVEGVTGFPPGGSRRSRSRGSRRCSSTGRCSRTRWSGSVQARTGTWLRWRRPTSSASRVPGPRT